MTREGAAQRGRGELRAAALTKLLPRAREVLAQFGASEVWLLGSLANGGCTPTSDVDLAVLGLPRIAYFDALADLMEALGTRVDLVRIEDAPESLTARVHAEGRRL